eukprot:998-Heterococcus_DN1.PRE.2
MAKANEDLDELVQQGKVESIDAHLVPDFGTEAGNADDDDDAAASDSSDSEAAAAAAEPSAEGKPSSDEKRVVQLSFAIGDFDDTPMAKLEDQQEAAEDSAEQMVTLTELSDVVDGANAADSSSGASEPQKAAAPPKGKLIQEL